jgi:glycogen phosphorylase
VSHATADTVSWWQRARGDDEELLVAYFSMEFGIHERLPIYSGGLGVLAGDHLKAAASLGVPLVGIGLLYTGGYFRQGVDEAGRQTEDYQRVDPEAVGLVREDVTVSVDLDGTTIEAGVWRKDVTSDVGTVPLYLLEVDWLTDALYGGDREHRIRQELLLGVGGVRALAALGIEPNVFHLNEGHSAFLQLERVRTLVADGVDTDEALERVRRSSVFTTHTPVPAGNEIFDAQLVARYVAPLAAEAGVSEERLLELGRYGDDPGFGLTPFALRLSAFANGVSDLHGEVAREMWTGLWPGEEPRIGHITNGVHIGTWLEPALAELLRHAGVNPEAPLDEANWEAARDAPSDAVWRVHTAAKTRLTETAGIDRQLLTIGFARRFAAYKRAGLVFSDVERLLALPIQIVVAGKAHPQDTAGKDVMQEVVRLARSARARGRIVFLENYDMGVARALVRGCDVWLNTPTRPLEASGTSGMKAAVNGVLNLSVLDGWWAEGYSPDVGWAIDGESDDADREQLYRLLEEQVVPTYTNDRERWVWMMKESIARLAPRFAMQRAVVEYVERYYLPAYAFAHR